MLPPPKRRISLKLAGRNHRPLRVGRRVDGRLRHIARPGRRAGRRRVGGRLTHIA
jgi:hypothetical protein